MDASVRISGLKEVAANLRKLDLRVERKLGMQALRAGAKIIVKQARENAPTKTGRLKRAIGVMAIKDKGKIELQVGVKRGKKRSDLKGAWYAHFLEFGTITRAAHPFITPAVESTQKEVVEKVKEEIHQLIERESFR